MQPTPINCQPKTAVKPSVNTTEIFNKGNNHFHNFNLGILHVHMNVSESITLLIANCMHAA